MYYEPLKKVRIDTARRSESRTVESHTRDLSYTVGAAPNYLTDDNRWANDNDSQSDVDDLFAEWESDPLATVESARPRDVVHRVLCRNTNCHTPRRRVQHARRLLSFLPLSARSMFRVLTTVLLFCRDARTMQELAGRGGAKRDSLRWGHHCL